MTWSIRSVVSYNLYFVLVAILAFWVYFQTLDAEIVATMTTTSLESNGSATAEWASSQQTWLQSELAPVISLGSNVKTGVTGVR